MNVDFKITYSDTLKIVYVKCTACKILKFCRNSRCNSCSIYVYKAVALTQQIFLIVV